ncbi:MAG: ABC transporter permease [Candidatus Omnitrophica bacterium]|nr:ABC transporter permease [Candidatus Omnitrophota bacterium]
MNHLRALIQYRHLLWDLAIKDIKVRYRSPTLGFLWAIIVPLIMVFIFKFIFSVILRAQVENYPFFIYLMTAIFPWTYFSSSVSSATECIFSNRDLIKKTYFPRQIIPISVVLANLINFIPALIVMFLVLALFKMQFTILIFLLPGILLLQTIFTIGLALIVSSLQVVLRDVRYIVELLLMAWLYFSPGFYSLTMVANFSEAFLKLYILNPFVGLFSLYRIALLKGYANTLPPKVNIFALSVWVVIVCCVTFLFGLLVFKRYESRFSDLV